MNLVLVFLATGFSGWRSRSSPVWMFFSVCSLAASGFLTISSCRLIWAFKFFDFRLNSRFVFILGASQITLGISQSIFERLQLPSGESIQARLSAKFCQPCSNSPVKSIHWRLPRPKGWIHIVYASAEDNVFLYFSAHVHSFLHIEPSCGAVLCHDE